MLKATTLTLVASLLVGLCTCDGAGHVSRAGSELRVTGAITSDTFTQVSSFLEQPGVTRLMIASEGGSSWASANLALLIQRNDIELVVQDHCLSSCAEYLLPAAKKLDLRETAVIGFHGNPQLERQLLREAGEQAPFCGEQAARALELIYRASGANSEFWRSQREVLKPHNVRVVDGRSCKTVTYKTEIETWLPARRDLEALLGRNLPGPVCADDPECVQTRALPLLGLGRPIMAAGRRYPLN